MQESSPIQAVCKAYVRETPPPKQPPIRFSTSFFCTWIFWWYHWWNKILHHLGCIISEPSPIEPLFPSLSTWRSCHRTWLNSALPNKPSLPLHFSKSTALNQPTSTFQTTTQKQRKQWDIYFEDSNGKQKLRKIQENIPGDSIRDRSWSPIWRAPVNHSKGHFFTIPKKITIAELPGNERHQKILIRLRPTWVRESKIDSSAQDLESRRNREIVPTNEKNPYYFPWNPGWLIGILIIV